MLSATSKKIHRITREGKLRQISSATLRKVAAHSPGIFPGSAAQDEVLREGGKMVVFPLSHFTVALFWAFGWFQRLNFPLSNELPDFVGNSGAGTA